MYTDKKNALRLNRFAWLVALSALIAVVFAISRASLAAYVLLIYFYALITRKKEIQYVIYSLLGASMFYLLFLMKDKNLIEYIVNTIQLNDSSSIGHLLEWVEGTQTIFTHPFGIGLGESGKVAAALQKNIGGENQFIIVGVQTGILSLFIYIAIYVLIIRNCWKYYPLLTGKAKMLALSLLLIKIAFIFPLFTSNFDSNSYIVFLTWLLTGIFISMIQNVKTVKI
jgi:O-antigen ligase